MELWRQRRGLLLLSQLSRGDGGECGTNLMLPLGTINVLVLYSGLTKAPMPQKSPLRNEQDPKIFNHKVVIWIEKKCSLNSNIFLSCQLNAYALLHLCMN